MANKIMETDEEYLDRLGDGTPEGNFARADGYNRMANAAVADYNSRPAPDDWNGALRAQQRDEQMRLDEERNAALAQQISANRGVYDGYAQMGNTVAARQAQFMGNANAHLASSLRLAAENGGRLPRYAWQGLGGALGLDEKNAAVVGGGFDKKGGFMLAVARRNPQTGQVEQVPMSFSPQQQYSLMLSAPGIFSRQEVEGMRGQLIDNFHMHPDQVPQVPQGWGETGNVGVGNRTATGGTSVNPNWLFGPQRRSSISAFGADGRGGFTNYDSNEQTGYQLVQQDSGTRAAEDKGRWKVLSKGADPNSDDGTQITRYENDKTGEVVSVRDGETPPWESRTVSEKERIAMAREQGQMERSRMNNESRERLQQQKNEAAIQVAETSAGATKSKADAMKYVADVRAKIKEAQSGKGGWTPTAGDLAKLGKLMNYESGLSDGQRNEVASLMSGMAEVMAKGLEKEKKAPPPPGKTEVKPGDNGGGDGRQGANDDGLPDNAQSRRYPGFKVSTVKKAIANGYVYDEEKGGFVKPKR